MPMLLTLAGGAGGPFVPTNIAGLSLWMDFSDAASLFQNSGGTGAVSSDGDPIGYATDKSGSGRHHTQATSSKRPTYRANVQNGKSVARFDGVDDLVRPALALAGASATAFVVVKIDADSPLSSMTGLWTYGSDIFNSAHYPWTDGTIYEQFGTSSRKTTANPTPSLAAWNVYAVLSKSGEFTTWLNGSQLYTTGTNTVDWASAANSALGSSTDGATYMLDGDVGEVIVYGADIGATDRASVLAYLQAKWGTP